MGMLMMVLGFARSPLGRYGLVALAALAALFWFTRHERNIGRDEVVKTIEHDNGGLKHDADEAERRVRDCVADGGLWSSATAQCGKKP